MEKIKTHLLTFGKHLLIVLLIGFVISLTFGGLGIFSSWDVFVKVTLYCLVIGLSLWYGSNLTGLVVNHFLAWNSTPLKTLLVHISSLFVYSAIAIFVVNLFFFESLFGVSMFTHPKFFSLVGIIQLIISMIITSVYYVIHFFKEWQQAMRLKEEMKREALAQSYEALKSQLNPHFLFNSLSVLSALVEKDTRASQDFIRKLSDVYRYVLEQKDQELVPIKEELDFVKAFLSLNQIRHGKNLTFVLQDENTSGYVIPMSVQLLVENALKHNEISSENPLSIEIQCSGEHIRVSNNIQLKSHIVESGGIGLNALKKRIEFVFGKPLLINTENNTFTVFVPIASTLSTTTGTSAI